MLDDCQQQTERPHDPAIRERMQDIVRRVGKPPAMPRPYAAFVQGDTSTQKKKGRPATHAGDPKTSSLMFAQMSGGHQVRLELETQREIMQMWEDGLDVTEICSRTKVHPSTVSCCVERGIIMPTQVPIYRCKGCGSKTESSPCFVCESRKLARRIGRGVAS
jgi:hypothetical protein